MSSVMIAQDNSSPFTVRLTEFEATFFLATQSQTLTHLLNTCNCGVLLDFFAVWSSIQSHTPLCKKNFWNEQNSINSWKIFLTLLEKITRKFRNFLERQEIKLLHSTVCRELEIRKTKSEFIKIKILQTRLFIHSQMAWPKNNINP